MRTDKGQAAKLLDREAIALHRHFLNDHGQGQPLPLCLSFPSLTEAWAGLFPPFQSEDPCLMCVPVAKIHQRPLGQRGSSPARGSAGGTPAALVWADADVDMSTSGQAPIP